jgi:acetyltransferase-like isoleucine patch superfamily enzyme
MLAMNKIVRLLSDIWFLLRKGRSLLFHLHKSYPERTDYGSLPSNSSIAYPCHIGVPKNLFVEDYVLIRYGLTVINAKNESVFIKKYTVIAPDVTIVTNSHRSTVGIPQIILGEGHINDKSANVIIEEDVWIGTRVTILAGVTLGRGCIVAANALVTKPVPPYALVAGMPARIVGVKFSLVDIERHEEALYLANERLSHEELVSLFDEYYHDKKVFGCSNPLTEEQQSLVNELKKRRGLHV